MGTLRIHGTIDITQFWFLGESDADTTKIKLLVDKDSFEYKKEGASRFAQTDAFEKAISKGQGSKPVIKVSKKDGSRTITVRLQGVDAPELHYNASALRQSPDISDAMRTKFNTINKSKRKQHFAESSTVALSKHLGKYMNSQGFIDCVFESEVDHPFEVVDTYGRFIGNVFLKKRHDINIWLVENGWGIPAFYTSMSVPEIHKFLKACTKGKKHKDRSTSSISKDAGVFDWDLLYRKPDKALRFDIGEDSGKVLIPKIFRRQVSWNIAKKAGVISKSTPFKTYLKKSPDQLVLLDEFLSEGVHSATVFALHDFVTTENKIEKDAEEFVFKEKPGTLVDENGKKVIDW